MSRRKRPRPPWFQSVKQTPSTILMAFCFAVVIPALVTAGLPVTWIQLERSGTGVKVTSRQCLLFVVPYKINTLFPITEIQSEVTSARSQRPTGRHRSNTKDTTIEGKAKLIFIGRDGKTVQALASPASIERLEKLAQEFLAAPTDTPLTLFSPANWKFSVIGGGVFTCFTVLYLIGCSIAIPLWIVKQLRQFGSKIASLGSEPTIEQQSAEPPGDH